MTSQQVTHLDPNFRNRKKKKKAKCTTTPTSKIIQRCTSIVSFLPLTSICPKGFWSFCDMGTFSSFAISPKAVCCGNLSLSEVLLPGACR